MICGNFGTKEQTRPLSAAPISGQGDPRRYCRPAGVPEGKDLTKKYPLVSRDLLEAIKVGTVLDGELVAFDDEGQLNFNAAGCSVWNSCRFLRIRRSSERRQGRKGATVTGEEEPSLTDSHTV